MLFYQPLPYLQQDLEQPHPLEQLPCLHLFSPSSLIALSSAISLWLLTVVFSLLSPQLSLHLRLDPHPHPQLHTLFPPFYDKNTNCIP